MTNAQQVWVISIVSALVGGLSAAIASFYFAKSLNKTSLAMEFLKQLMAQYAEGAQLEALLRQRAYGGLKSLSPSEMDLILK